METQGSKRRVRTDGKRRTTRMGNTAREAEAQHGRNARRISAIVTAKVAHVARQYRPCYTGLPADVLPHHEETKIYHSGATVYFILQAGLILRHFCPEACNGLKTECTARVKQQNLVRAAEVPEPDTTVASFYA